MSSSPRAVVIGHGEFAAGLVSAVEQISGMGQLLLPLTTTDLAGSGIETMVRERLESTGLRIVFTDLPGGSATMAVRRLQRSLPDLTIVSGTNLPLLLEFLNRAGNGQSGAEGGGGGDAALAALERGRAAMLVFRGTLAG